MGAIKDFEKTFLAYSLKLRLAHGARKNRERKKALTVRHGSAEQHASAQAFYAPYCRASMIFHDFYFDKTGVWDDRYIPDDLYFSKIDPFFNYKRKAAVLENKTYYGKMFTGIKQPSVFACRLNHFWLDGSNERISFEDVLKRAENEPELIIKIAIGSSGGHGVFFVDNKNASIAQDMADIIKKIDNDIIIQRPVRQCEALNRLSASSVNTIRFLSLLSQDGVKIHSALVRMGINNSRVDNDCSGGISCGIDENGRLRPVAYTGRGERFEKHPTSGVKFDSVVIPNYEAIKQTVCKLAIQVPHFRMVSWDIAVDAENEPVLIEANLAGGGVDIHQLCNGPLFGEDTKKVLDELFGKSTR